VLVTLCIAQHTAGVLKEVEVVAMVLTTAESQYPLLFQK